MAFNRIRKFLRLNGEQKWLFIEAYLTLGVMRAAILTISFKRLSRSMEQQKDAVAPALDETQMDKANAIGKAVTNAVGSTPWESACLAQALTAQRMLSKRDIGGVFYLGATMDDTDKNKIKAHAWLQCGEEIITGEAGYEDYAVLSTFIWKGKRPL